MDNRRQSVTVGDSFFNPHAVQWTAVDRSAVIGTDDDNDDSNDDDDGNDDDNDSDID